MHVKIIYFTCNITSAKPSMIFHAKKRLSLFTMTFHAKKLTKSTLSMIFHVKNHLTSYSIDVHHGFPWNSMEIHDGHQQNMELDDFLHGKSWKVWTQLNFCMESHGKRLSLFLAWKSWKVLHVKQIIFTCNTFHDFHAKKRLSLLP